MRWRKRRLHNTTPLTLVPALGDRVPDAASPQEGLTVRVAVALVRDQLLCTVSSSGGPRGEEAGPLGGGLPPFLLAHRWPERGSTSWQLRHERVTVAAVEGVVEGAGGGGVVGGLGGPRHEGPA